MKRSVALAAYNGEAYIEEQLTSILQTLCEGDEVIVSDDGSTDGTRDIVRDVAARDDRVRLIDGPCKGLIRNFENALMHCTGDVVFLADQDDVWHADKVDAVLACFEETGAVLVLHDAQMTDNERHVLSPSFFAFRGSRAGYFRNLWKNAYIGACMAFKRELLEVALPFDERIPMHDQWLGLLAEKRGGAAFLPEVLIDYRRHEGTVTKDHHGRLSVMLANRVNMWRAVSKRLRETGNTQTAADGTAEKTTTAAEDTTAKKE